MSTAFHVFIMKRYWILFIFSASIEFIMCFCFILLLWYMTLIDFHILTFIS